MTTWRQRLVAYERDVPFPVQSPVKGFWKKSGQRSYAPSRYSSEAEWSGSRLLTGHSKVRFLPLELSSSTRGDPTRKQICWFESNPVHQPYEVITRKVRSEA